MSPCRGHRDGAGCRWWVAASGAVRSMALDIARRTALAAQGFADPRPAAAGTRRHLMRVLDRIRVLQLDSVSVLVRGLPGGIQPAWPVSEGTARRRRMGAPGTPSPAAGGVLGPRGESASGTGLAAVAVGGQGARLVAAVRSAGRRRTRTSLGRAGRGERAWPGKCRHPGA